ncbi:sensor histidine kinase [Neobacillus sp. LXY-4]|uniref:sensor histidine kinase n=1 Tax=Neobacillus sp. LXY-4 TaxID=3379826 RepID=UPI003EE12595
MATKWRSRIKLAVWAFLFTIGLSGLLSIMTISEQYFYQDYFQTPEFQAKLELFASNLSKYELIDTTEKDAKNSIVVTNEEIEEHRYRYGNLNDQVSNIKVQYESKIEEAVASNNEGVANTYRAERDAKIADITKNFESDEHVRNKIVKEKEQVIEDFFKKRERVRSLFLRDEKVYKYYLKDTTTGKVYTNLKKSEQDSVNDYMNKKNMYYVTNYTFSRDYLIENHLSGYQDIAMTLLPEKTGNFEGQIGLPKNVSSSSLVMKEYQKYKKIQIVMILFTIVSITSLIGSLVYVKKSRILPEEISTWQPYYNRLPIDVRVLLLGFSLFSAVLYLFMANDQFYFILENPVRSGMELVTDLVISSIFWILAFIQGKFLFPVFKDWHRVEVEYKLSLLSRAWNSVQDAFLIQKIGVQFVILYGLVFSFSFFLAALTGAWGLLPLHYFLLQLAFVGLPIFVIHLKRTGYFNKIVLKTSEIASGKLGPDLPVKGKSTYATLAANINRLKQGVKTSQNEQAKSERLKTELITNVSHDLRTPLTSIINYTELLKNGELTPEDRAAYLEVIDRKSKRLKVLIDDLFEVSKMASGNMELSLEKVDIVQLLQQTLAEFDEAINHSTLQFRVTHSEKPIYAVVDGQKLWRVFDNLIGNILKYSLEYTRVFITVSKKNDKVEITFKNISRFELGENSDELFERFKRGDTSRHTEGSGLGLAIAKSIVDLHDGSLDIEIDGDLFKVRISLNLVE